MDPLVFAACAIGVLLAASCIAAAKRGDGGAERRIARLEAKIDRILAHYSIRFDQKGWSDAEVARLIAEGRTIEAIRAYREQHPHAGLREAKQHVDELAAMNR